MASPPKFRLLTHFRGIAAFGVLLSHLFGGAGLDKGVVFHPSIVSASCFTQWGFAGVDIFFVISGYCISASLIKYHRLSGGPWKFMTDRCIRIYPVFWGAWLCSIAIGLFVDLLRHRDPWLRFSAGPWEWAAHFFLFDLYAGFGPAMDVTWTLVFEMTFYLMAAMALLATRLQISRNVVALAMAGASFASLAGNHHGVMIAFQYLPEFLCGIIVYQTLRPGASLPLAVVALVLLPLFSWFLRPVSDDG